MDERKPRRSGKKVVFLLLLGVAAWAAITTFRTGGQPNILIEPEMPGIGRRTPIQVRFEEKSRGLDRLQVEFIQGDRVEVLAQSQHQPREPWRFWGPAVAEDEIRVEVGSETIEGLKTGEATIRASAWPAETWLRHPDPVAAEVVLPVRLSPPAVQVRSSHNYVAPGGSGVVIYRVGETSVRDGVQIEDLWFPGFALQGGEPGLRFALFAVPFDLVDGNKIQLTATDDVGNQALVSFVDKYLPRRYSTDTIEISDSFMERVVPAIMAATPGIEDQGDLLQNYLWINGELRRRNAQTLTELAAVSREEFLWNQVFMPMSNAQVMSSFADRRTYRYQGEDVDQQDHMGFDLASVVHAEIEAANRGIVVLARYFGIYGNAVVIDHGYGLMSIYGHLSSIAVSEGEMVEKGQVVGRSGETGLAGGDHLHFSFLIHGQPVNPVEWWDAAWIRDRFAAKLGSAFTFQP
jgi:murein DD-endopeptidase MepM/ murein hydrolase activator NlpD